MRALVISLAVLLSTPAVALAAPCEKGTPFMAWYRPLRDRSFHRSPFQLQPGLTLVAANPDALKKQGGLPEPGHLVELSATELRLRGQLTTDAAFSAELRRVFVDAAALSADTHSGMDDGMIEGGLIGTDAPRPVPPPPAPRPAPSLVVFAIAADVPWSRVAATVNAARKAGTIEIAFVFTATHRDVAPPGPSPLDARLAKVAKDTDPARKATALRAMVDGVVASCPNARAIVDTTSGHAILNAHIYVEECKCDLDLASLGALAWHMSYVESPVMMVRGRIAGKKSVKLAIAGKTPWTVAHKQVLAKFDTGRPVVLVSR